MSKRYEGPSPSPVPASLPAPSASAPIPAPAKTSPSAGNGIAGYSKRSSQLTSAQRATQEIIDHVRRFGTPDIVALLDRFRFDGRPHVVQGVKLGNLEHEFVLSITMAQGLRNETRQTHVTQTGTTVHHQIETTVSTGPFFFDEENPDALARTPEGRRLLIAQSLFHELHHVLLIIDGQLPAGEAHGPVATGYRRVKALAEAPLVDSQRVMVRQALARVAAEAAVADAGEFLVSMWEFIIQEKVVSSMAAGRSNQMFHGAPVNNAAIAERYAKEVVARAIKLGSVEVRGETRAILERAMLALYEALDGAVGASSPSPTQAP